MNETPTLLHPIPPDQAALLLAQMAEHAIAQSPGPISTRLALFFSGSAQGALPLAETVAIFRRITLPLLALALMAEQACGIKTEEDIASAPEGVRCVAALIADVIRISDDENDTTIMTPPPAQVLVP